MEQWISFARGPLFAFSLLVMILGLVRLTIIQIYSLVLRKGRRLRNVPWRKIAVDAASWVIPIRHLIPGTRFFSIASYLFHIGIIAVPLFLMDHVVLWKDFCGINLPAIGRQVGDTLTLFTIVCIVLLFGCRLFIPRLRSMSMFMDYVVLAMIFVPFASGYLASHPHVNPFPWQVMMLVHILSAELLFMAVPFTKLSHIVLFFFDRISQLHWQLRPGAGDQVAEALYGEEARV
ncbi:MAG: respiratory nitrate reductase subunit gamma [FCB group bacterium]|nr:respiratory nitrate reductase subunit gamma [FCB group bacterium]